MKKSIIAGAGVMSLAAAAMPFMGVFAADGTMSQTDTVTVTVETNCALATTATGAYTETIANGNAEEIDGSTFTVTCNDNGGWKLSAVGDGTGATKDLMVGSATSNTIATGTTFSGATSEWGFKMADPVGNASIVTGYDAYKEVPTSAVKVASGTGTTAGTDKVSAKYKVWISATQAADSYTGKVTYTLAHPDA